MYIYIGWYKLFDRLVQCDRILQSILGTCFKNLVAGFLGWKFTAGRMMKLTLQTRTTSMDAVVCIGNWRETQLPYYIILPNFNRWEFIENNKEVLHFVCYSMFCFNQGPIIILQMSHNWGWCWEEWYHGTRGSSISWPKWLATWVSMGLSWTIWKRRFPLYSADFKFKYAYYYMHCTSIFMFFLQLIMITVADIVIVSTSINYK